MSAAPSPSIAERYACGGVCVSDMPPELLWMLTEYLYTDRDLLRVACLCVSWRAIALKQLRTRSDVKCTYRRYEAGKLKVPDKGDMSLTATEFDEAIVTFQKLKHRFRVLIERNPFFDPRLDVLPAVFALHLDDWRQVC
jgi:F-box-like